jgi:hypothetical protein
MKKKSKFPQVVLLHSLILQIKNIKKQKLNSDRGNRTPGCRVRDDDVSHYTISDDLCRPCIGLGLGSTFTLASCVLLPRRAWFYIVYGSPALLERSNFFLAPFL